MRKELPIASAPKDGSKITVVWTDEDGRRNESIAQYRSLDRLKAGGGQWDESDTGWWTFTDSTTQRKIEPTAWISGADDDADDNN
ncbi:MAG: hypothetical protein J0H18_09610 [Rhizobiales bacterium]|nr:hypothetical protein [Hyphomicrobiales bacterium]OJX98759.1 MAG: hypothetical protein BGP07_13615 [Rhizobiales bacterium 63-22]